MDARGSEMETQREIERGRERKSADRKKEKWNV